MRFFKMNGLGNDYIFIPKEECSEITPAQIKKLCDVHVGIGGDGVVLYQKEIDWDLSMWIYNRDGSEAEMCGNALRCLIRHNNVPNKTIFVKTRSGIKYGIFDGDRVKINLGKSVSIDTKIYRFTLKGKRIEGYRVNIGNPHFVISGMYDDKLAEAIASDTRHFPEKTNVEFVTRSGENLIVRVYERGCGETMACGTGAAAAFAVSNKQESTVILPGGKLFCQMIDGEIYQTGKAEYNYTGEWQDV